MHRKINLYFVRIFVIFCINWDTEYMILAPGAFLSTLPKEVLRPFRFITATYWLPYHLHTAHCYISLLCMRNFVHKERNLRMKLAEFWKKKIVLNAKRHTHTYRSPSWYLRHLISSLNGIFLVFIHFFALLNTNFPIYICYRHNFVLN
jgi:hypothetical protein